MAIRLGQWNIGITQIQYLLLLASEAAWAYPWALTVGVWIMGNGQAALDPVAVGVILALALAATRLAAGRSPRSVSARLALTALAVLSTAAVALIQLSTFGIGSDPALLLDQLLSTSLGRRAATSAGFAVFLWWRAVGLGRSPMNLSTVEDGFRSGTVAMTTLLVFAGMAGKASPLSAESLLLSTVVVVSAGLVGMPLARVVDVGRSQGRGDGAALKIGVPWLGMLLGVVGTLLAATLLLAQLFTFQRVTAVWEAVAGPVGSVLAVTVRVLALPFGLLVELLLFLIRLVQRPGAARPPRQTGDLDWLQQLQQGEPAGLSPEVQLALKVALAVGLAVLLAWIVGRAMARLRRGWERDEVEETHDFVWSMPGLLDLWRWLVDRWRPLRARVLSGLPGTMALQGEAESVRALYREFLTLGATLGHPRKSAETPLEYERRLFGDPHLPGEGEVRSITDEYNHERYGQPTPPSHRLPLVSSALARLRSLWADSPST